MNSDKPLHNENLAPTEPGVIDQMTATPRTDDAEVHMWYDHSDGSLWGAEEGYWVKADFARELERALRDLVVALNSCEPAIVNAFVFQDIHGISYSGPTYEKEFITAQQVLAGTTGELSGQALKTTSEPNENE